MRDFLADLDGILKEWGMRTSTGGTDLSLNEENLFHLRNTLVDANYPLKFIDALCEALLSEVTTETPVKYKDKDGKSATMRYGSAIRLPAAHPAKIEAEKLKGNDAPEEKTKGPEEKKSVVARAKDGDVPAQLKVQYDELSKKKKEDDGKATDSAEEVSKLRTENDKNLKYFLDHGFAGSEGAPGNASSMWNEVISGMISEHMFEKGGNEEELINHTIDTYGKTKLGRENNGKSIAGYLKAGDIPKDVAKSDRAIYSKTVLAVRSAMRKVSKAEASMDKLDWKKKDCEMLSFFGDHRGLARQKELISSADSIVTLDKHGNKVILSKEEMLDLIDSSGKGDNPSDTATVVINNETNEVMIQFHSDKMSPNATISQSTPGAELIGDESKQVIDELLKSGLIDDQTHDRIWEAKQKGARELKEKQNELRTLTGSPAKSFAGMSKDANKMSELISDIKVSSTGDDPSKYWKSQLVKPFRTSLEQPRKTSGQLTTKAENALKYLPGRPGHDSYETRPPTDEEITTAFFNKAADGEPTKNDQKVLVRLQTKHGTGGEEELSNEIERIRKESLDIEVNIIRELDKTQITIGGIEIGVGTLAEANNIWHKAHLDSITQDSGVHRYPDMFEVNMSGYHLDGKILSDILGLNNKENFIQRFVVDEGKDTIGTRKGSLTFGRVTGRTRIVYAILKGPEGNEVKLPIMEKSLRSKSGPLGSLETAYKWTLQMQTAIKEHSKNF